VQRLQRQRRGAVQTLWRDRCPAATEPAAHRPPPTHLELKEEGLSAAQSITPAVASEKGTHVRLRALSGTAVDTFCAKMRSTHARYLLSKIDSYDIRRRNGSKKRGAYVSTSPNASVPCERLNIFQASKTRSARPSPQSVDLAQQPTGREQHRSTTRVRPPPVLHTTPLLVAEDGIADCRAFPHLIAWQMPIDFTEWNKHAAKVPRDEITLVLCIIVGGTILTTLFMALIGKDKY
jgi:hypothetical protein